MITGPSRFLTITFILAKQTSTEIIKTHLMLVLALASAYFLALWKKSFPSFKSNYPVF
jgi:hypothetical protein